MFNNHSKKRPGNYLITLIVEDGKEFSYSVPTIKFQDEDMSEVIRKHMIILLPFKLLKIRERFKREYDSYTQNGDKEKLHCIVQELRDIYERDIIKTIEASFKNEDCDHLYSKYSSLEEVDNMLYDQSLDLDIDRYMDRIEELEEEVSNKDEAIAEKDNTIAEKDALIEQLQNELNRYKS